MIFKIFLLSPITAYAAKKKDSLNEDKNKELFSNGGVVLNLKKLMRNPR